MSSISVEFEFEIGDLVYFRSATHNIGNKPKAFVVIERIAQQCHGGIQRLYKLTNVDGHAPEIALTKEMPPYQPLSEAELTDRTALVLAENAGHAEHHIRWKAQRSSEKE